MTVPTEGFVPSAALSELPVIRDLPATLDSESSLVPSAGSRSRCTGRSAREYHFEPSLPAFISLARDDSARLFLSEHRGDARPDTLVYFRVSDVDAVASEFAVDIIDQPWGREVHLIDLDGNRLRVGTPRR